MKMGYALKYLVVLVWFSFLLKMWGFVFWFFWCFFSEKIISSQELNLGLCLYFKILEVKYLT